MKNSKFRIFTKDYNKAFEMAKKKRNHKLKRYTERKERERDRKRERGKKKEQGNREDRKKDKMIQFSTKELLREMEKKLKANKNAEKKYKISIDLILEYSSQVIRTLYYYLLQRNFFHLKQLFFTYFR